MSAKSLLDLFTRRSSKRSFDEVKFSKSNDPSSLSSSLFSSKVESVFESDVTMSCKDDRSSFVGDMELEAGLAGIAFSSSKSTEDSFSFTSDVLLPEQSSFELKGKKLSEDSRACPPTPKRVRKRNPVLDEPKTHILFQQKGDCRCHYFAFDEEIGAGSFGRIWSVVSKKSGSRFALKESKEFLSSVRERDILLRSLENLNKLLSPKGEWHPNILRHFAVWQEGCKLYIQTELCENSDLAKFFGKKASVGDLNEPDIWRLIEEIGPAMQLMHENGILHMDIKPDNIYVTKEGRFKLGDFGMSLAKEYWTKVSDHEGDSAYLAPELLREGKLGPAVDVFSFGMSLHQLVSGECVHITQLSDPKYILPKLQFPISRELGQLITMMINPKLEERATMKDILSVLMKVRRQHKRLLMLSKMLQ